MSDRQYNLSSELGATLAGLRNEQADKMTQTYIAQHLGIAQSRVSRIEKGDVSPTDSEIEGYLNTIGTENAKAYCQFLKVAWKHLKRPSFRHPQREEICEAEIFLQKLENFKSQPKLSQQFINEADLYGDTLRREAEYLANLNHCIAYVGEVGIGKTTAVCKLTGLFNLQKKKLKHQCLLSTASGRTTACEVRIKQGEKLGIVVEPKSQEEISKTIEDIWKNAKNRTEEDDGQTNISWENRRALVNLIKPEGENVNGEELLENLLSECENLKTFRAEIFDRLKSSETKQKEFWYEEEETSELLGNEWLEKQFKDINYSLDKQIPLPQRIDVFSKNILKSSPYVLEVVDTKGVDIEGSASSAGFREDLINYIDDDRTLSVLCCKFKDAPGNIVYKIVDNLIKTREEAFKERVIILVLVHNDEAIEMVDENGEEVEEEEEGYKLKQNEVEKKLKKLLQKCQQEFNIPILFFNAKSEEQKSMTAEIDRRLENLRLLHCDLLLEAKNALGILIKDVEEKNAIEARERVIKDLKSFLEDAKLREFRSLIHEEVLEEMKKAHYGKVKATIKRRGEYSNLNVYVLLSNAARGLAWARSYKAFHELTGIIKVNLRNQELKPVHNFLKLIQTNWYQWRESFLQDAKKSGELTFRYSLKPTSVWEECMEPDANGKFSRDRAIDELQHWFDDPEQERLHDLFNAKMEAAWQELVLDKLRKLTDDGTEEAE